MTTLRAQINELDRLLHGHQEDEQEKLAIGRTVKMTAKIRDGVAPVTGLVNALTELKRAGIEFTAPTALKALPSAIKEAREAAREDGLAAGRGDEPAVVALAELLADEVKVQIAPAWASLKGRDSRPVMDEQLLGVAAEADPSLPDRVERAQSRLALLDMLPKPNEGDVGRWIATVEELRKLAAQVIEAAPSQEVQRFLAVAAQPGGAPVDLLESEGVWAWVTDPARATRYRVVVRDK